MSGIELDAYPQAEEFRIFIPYQLANVREQFKETVHGRRWHDPTKTWRVKASLIQIDRIEQWLNEMNAWGYSVEVTDDAHRLTDRIRQRFEDGAPTLEDRPEDDVLYGFQREGVNKIKALGGKGLMAWSCGAGKTPASILLADELGAYPVVSVVPASVKYQWRGEVHKFLTELTDRRPNVTVDVLEGYDDELDQNVDWVITNYAILSDITRNGTTYEGWLDPIRQMGPGTIIVDEAHYVKNPDSKRSQAVQALCAITDHEILLTGTPIVNEPKDLANLLDIIGVLDDYGGEYGLLHRYYDPTEQYVGRGKTVTKWERENVKNLDELHATLEHKAMSRIKKEDVIDEMPPLNEHKVLVRLDNEAEYRRIEDEMKALAQRSDPEAQGEALGKIVELRQACGKGKVSSAIEITKNIIEEGGAPLVFTEFKAEVCNPIIEALQNDYDVSYITGDVKGEERQTMTDMYMEGITDVMVCTSAAEEGVTLTRAHNMVMVEMPWTPKSIEQRIGRAHARMNDLHGLDVKYLTAENTIDESVWQAVQEKREIFEQAIDGKEGASWETEIVHHHFEEGD